MLQLQTSHSKYLLKLNRTTADDETHFPIVGHLCGQIYLISSMKKGKNQSSKNATEDGSAFSGFLYSLPNTGSDGLEGLVNCLLSELTGYRFVLAKSGSQFGRDGQSLPMSRGSVMFECKNYSASDLKIRDLLGEIEQAVTDDDTVDLWVLVVSNQIKSQVITALTKKTNKESIDFLPIDSTPDGSGDLDALCAMYPDVLTDMMTKLGKSKKDISDSKTAMYKIASQPGFASKIESLRERLTKPSLAWPYWLSESRKKWMHFVSDKDKSRSRFKQHIDLLNTNSPVIPRTSASQKISDWFDSWKQSTPPLMIIGDEGAGKTWAIADWITTTQKSSEKPIPPIVFVSSTDTRGKGSLEELMIERLNEDFGDLNWKKRLTRWMHTIPPETEGPVAIVVLDGINERQDITFWRNVLDTSLRADFKNSVAIICTVRTSYWERYLAPLKHLKPSICEVKDYDENELKQALALRNYKLQDFPQSLHGLLAKPRYLDLALTFREELVKSGDFTVARLIYEDWKDRYSRKNTCSMTDEEFSDLLKSFGTEFMNGQSSWKQHEVAEKLALNIDRIIAFTDLSTGGVLERGLNGWKINRNSLALGLAMLLCEQITEGTNNNEVQEQIESWMGATPNGDLHSEVLELAALHSIMTTQNCVVRTELFAAWLNTQNPGTNLQDAVIQRFSAYLPDNAQTYFQLAERVWSRQFQNSCAEEILIRGFIRWAHSSEDVKVVLTQWLDRWLGVISTKGPLFLRNSNSTDFSSPEVKAQLETIFGNTLGAESQVTLDKHVLSLTDDDGLIRLPLVALAIISTFDQVDDFFKPLMTGLIADSIFWNVEKKELIDWILRSSPKDLSEKLCAYISQYDDSSSALVQQSVQQLLNACGTSQCWKIANDRTRVEKQTPSCDFATNEESALESYRSFSQNDLEVYPAKENFDPWLFLSRGASFFSKTKFTTTADISEHLMPVIERFKVDDKPLGVDFLPDENFIRDYEAGLARYCSDDFCEAMRELLRRMSHRITECVNSKPKSLHSLLRFKLYEYDLIFTNEMRQLWQETSTKICSEFQSRNFQFKHYESNIFRICLPLWSANEQLERFLLRSGYEYDLVPFEHLFLKNSELHFPELNSIEEWRRLIFFLHQSKQFLLTKQQIEKALTLEDEGFRGLVWSYIFHSEDLELISWWITRFDWHWNFTMDFRESEYGSALLIKYGTALSLEKLVDRISPTRKGTALENRGPNHGLSVEYAFWIDDMLANMLNFEIPANFPPIEMEYYSCLPAPRSPVSVIHSEQNGLIRYVHPMTIWGGNNFSKSTDFGKSESEINEKWDREYDAFDSISATAHGAGHYWIANVFHADAVKDAVFAAPELASKWMEGLFSKPSETAIKLKRGCSFYQTLCEVFFEIPEWHASARKLYVELSSHEGLINMIVPNFRYSRLVFSLMSADLSADTIYLWGNRLNSIKSDLELLELALLLRSLDPSSAAKKWFDEKIRLDLQSEIPFLVARSHALLGFLEENSTADWLAKDIPEESYWLNTVQKTAQARFFEEQDSRHWFRQFCKSNSNDEAWCGFRLFLECVDRRSYLWLKDDSKDLPLQRQYFLELNETTIENACNKNEHKLQNTFLACKANSNLFPWLSFSIPIEFSDRYS